MSKTFQLLCLTYLIGFANTGLACTTMAKIHLFDQIEHVSIFRNDTKGHEWATQENRELCAGDIVIVPKTLAMPLIVEYYTNPPTQKKLVAGDYHKIPTLSNHCGPSCKLQNHFNLLSHKMTHPESIFVIIKSTGGKAHPEWP